jgi:hypothetical protein
MNRIPTPILQYQSPYFLLHNSDPDIHSLKVFGSLVFASTLQNHRSKLDLRARKCIFLGYKSGVMVMGAILLDIHSKNIFLSGNVTHHEHIFPYQSSLPKVPWDYHSSAHSDNDLTSSSPLVDHFDNDNTTPNSDISLDTTSHQSLSPTSPSHQSPLPTQPTSNSHSPSSQDQHTRPIRQRGAPIYLSDYVCNSLSSSNESIPSGTIKYPLSSFHSLTHLSSSHKAYSMSITHCTEPQSYEEASKSEHWVTALDSELEALAKNCTWKLVELPSHTKPIGCKWVYKVKHKAYGTVERYKARLVAK